ncbi:MULTISPECIES: hypothetical protein [unclassified Mannheimia]|uniref:hypothetical protein n=1 Tax=unclassified Mannheimia TaxID=2645054 RepID=UPI00359E8803
MKKCFLSLILFLANPAIAFDPIEEGFAHGAKALQQNDLKQAAEIWFPLAERGHAGSLIYFFYVLSQDLSLAASNPKMMNLLMKMAQYNDADPIQYNQSEQILLWKVYQEHKLFDKAEAWLKKIGKTAAEAEAIFQQDKANAKVVLDDFKKGYPNN